jgi:hypothetical protein
MSKKLKEYSVVIEYNVQRTFTVCAKDEEQAEELVRNEKFENAYNDFEDNWDEIGTLEVKEVA